MTGKPSTPALKRVIETQLLFRNDQATPIGRLSLAGYVKGQGRAGFASMRVLGSYAIVYLLEGEGFYRGAGGFSCDLRAGDLITVFPELAHRYGPRRGQAWSEIYVVFDGAAFDLWREKGVLCAGRPVAHLQPVDTWQARIESTLGAGPTLEGVAAFLSLLTEMLAPQIAMNDASEEFWLARSRRMLEENLSLPLDMREVAREAGLSYESFRKRFAREVGVAPSRYRTDRRIEAARSLLLQSNLTLRAVADSLGFSDEFHFSRRFKEVTGQTPRAVRQNAGKEECQ